MQDKTVLLVEDLLENRIIYSTILSRHGYRVLEARNGKEGVRLAREERPDLILMDISLPVMDGWTAAEHIKGDQATAEIPIVALTANDLDRPEMAARLCASYLVKPCLPPRVLQEVQRLIGPGAAGVG